MPYSDPEKRKEYARKYRRKKRAEAAKAASQEANQNGIAETLLNPPETAEDLRRLLGNRIQTIFNDKNLDVLQSSRVLALLAGAFLDAWAKGDLETRLIAIEEKLNGAKG